MAPLLVICVDGATLDYAGPHGIFAGKSASRLRSVYPSSTAPAHASALTGVHAEGHGIVGNRFWDDDTPDVVRQARGGPLSCLHPYESTSLAAPSVVAELQRRGLRVAAVQFPHTFARERHDVAATYCLYAPAGELSWPIEGQTARGTIPFRDFGFEIPIEVDPRGAWSSGDARVRIAAHEGAADVHCVDRDRAISFRLTLGEPGGGQLRLARSTAVFTLCFGGVSAADVVGVDRPPHSTHVSYTANRAHDFHESPSVEWTTRTARYMLASRPDVLFLRYSQVDHAQEHLHWYATHGDAREREEATAQIAGTYRAVERGIGEVLGEAGSGARAVVFSDHGIDTVDTHLHPNTLLAEIGLDGDFVFQGDSSCAYLYGPRPLEPGEVRAVGRAARTRSNRVWIADRAELDALRAFHPGRVGRLALRCAPHTEFQYGGGAAVREVRSASHGFIPSDPAMDGVWIPLAGDAARISAPGCVTGVAAAVAALC